MSDPILCLTAAHLLGAVIGVLIALFIKTMWYARGSW